jgi:midasin (ATPase involved in ribosome maturation)
MMLSFRFTEFFVEELTDSTDLKILVGEYLKNKSVTMAQLDGIVKFYLTVRAQAASGKLRDGTGQRPHYRSVISSTY